MHLVSACRSVKGQGTRYSCSVLPKTSLVDQPADEADWLRKVVVGHLGSKPSAMLIRAFHEAHTKYTAVRQVELLNLLSCCLQFKAKVVKGKLDHSRFLARDVRKASVLGLWEQAAA